MRRSRALARPLALLAGLVLAAPCLARAQVPASDQLSGFYIGAFAGYAGLNTTVITPATTVTTIASVPVTVQTPSGPQTTTVTGPARVQVPSQQLKDQGGGGAIFGLRAGYGRLLWRDVYLGAELDVTFPQLATTHLQVLGRSVTGHLETEAGLYARAGWTPNGSTLFFARAGLAIPRQVVRSGTVKSESWTVTPALGLGIEHALTRHIAARIDLVFMPSVGDNQIGSTRGTVGIAYRF
jgi:opacity protein-like surface antigen